MIELGRESPREPLLAALYNAFERRLAQAGEAALHDTWRARLDTLGKDVTVTFAGGEAVHGRATGVDRDGALIVRRDDGAEQAFIAGEVTLRLA